MQNTRADHIANADDCLRRIETMIAKLEKSKTVPGVPLKSIVNEARGHLKEASNAAFDQHVHFALCADILNPFHLHEVNRSISRFSLAEPGRTVITKKHQVDADPCTKPPSAEDLMGRTVVVYSIVDTHGGQSVSLALHGDIALSSYQNDEFVARKSGQDPIIANGGVRHRLLTAKTRLPGKIDLNAVAKMVVESLGKTLAKPDIVSRTWYSFTKEYILDIVSVFALVAARQEKLEVPGVGDRIDLEIEDTLGRYLGMEDWNDTI